MRLLSVRALIYDYFYVMMSHDIIRNIYMVMSHNILSDLYMVMSRDILSD